VEVIRAPFIHAFISFNNVESMVKNFVLVLLAVASVGCSDASGPSEASYANIAGAYAGVMAGTTQGVALEAAFTITLTQNQGSISGSYSMSGDVTDGQLIVDVLGTGTVTGTISDGSNPSVNLTLRTGFCPSYTAPFTGTYDSANARLTLTGPVDILADDCTVALRYPMVLILTR
jgi:hypothetical protein